MNPILYLARHATPDWNRKDLVYHLPPGPPLTPQGRDEAQALGAFLSQEKVRAILSSPLERCLHTAQIVAELVQLPVEVIPELIEWQPGETELIVQERLCPVVERALDLDQPACLVTHGGPISALLGSFGMASDERKKIATFDHGNLLPPAGAWKATRRPVTGEDANPAQLDPRWEMKLVFQPTGIANLA
jgi:probable phosphoglycerate mutase